MSERNRYCCCSCEFWDVEGAINYEAGKMAICNQLSGNKHPQNKDTVLYAVNRSQRVFTRRAFWCNEYKAKK